MKLGCGHIFHAGCVRELLRHRWSTKRITFNFMRCPTCKRVIEGTDHVPEVRQELGQMNILKLQIAREALMELKVELFLDSHDIEEKVSDPKSRYYKNPHEYALSVSEFYECNRCKAPYFGGFINC